jgi:hypothetical protein
MPFNVPVGHKFSAVALDNVGVERDLLGEIRLGDDTWAVFGAPFDLDDHWREWLGSLQIEHLRRASLTIVATAPSNAVDVLDAENESLSQRALSLFYSLFLVEVFHFDGGLIISGANRRGDVSVRQVSTLVQFYRPAGVLPFRIDRPWLQNAYAIAEGMLAAHAEKASHHRLKKGFRAWVGAMQENYEDDRLHQFVRAVESMVKPQVGRSKAQFVHRGQVFAGNSQGAKSVLGELYELRGAAEHMNPFDDILLNYPAAQREQIALRRAFQAQVLASRIYQRIFTDANLRTTFSSDDLIERFWADCWAAQIAAWGIPVDLDAVADQRFRNDLIPR